MLVVSYYYPPDTSIGGRRWLTMARCLQAMGHDVTILTTQAWGDGDAGSVRVIRTPDLVASPWLRRLFRRPALPRPGQPLPVQTAPSRFLASGMVPDAYLVTWVLRAVLSARRLIRARNIDCVVTSGPPHSVHLLGLLLGRRRPAWVADFRDGWRFEPLRDAWPTRLQDLADGWMERAVARAAEVSVGVTRPIADDLGARLAAKTAYVPNGWDPEAAPSSAHGIPDLDPQFFNLVHTGTLSAEAGRDPRVLFQALSDLSLSDQPDARRIRLVLAGRISEADTELLAQAPPNVVHVGHLSPAASIALQRGADALLLLTTPGRRSEATGKLFEYLGSGRPIVALASENEASRILAETRTGIATAADDRAGIRDALMTLVDGRLTSTYAPVGLERYMYPSPADEFAAQIERAIRLNSGADPR